MTTTHTPYTLLALHDADPEGLNVIAAELAGWRRETRFSYRETPGWFHPNGVSMFNNPPHYSTSLDAVAELEAGLTREERHDYVRCLCGLMDGWNQMPDFTTTFAPAHLRLIAWVLTKQTI